MDRRHQFDGFVPEPEGIPSEFEFHIGGDLGASYKVELKNMTIAYTWYGSGRKGEERLAPDRDQWRSFRKKLDELDFWSWDRRYSDYKILDDRSWSAWIDWGPRRVESARGRACPAAFERVLWAVSELIGGRAFR